MRAIILFKSACQFPTSTSPYFAPCSPNLTTLTTNGSRTREKYSRTPSYLCISTIRHSILRSTTWCRRFLGAARCSTKQQTLIAPPHLTGNVPGECPKLIQPLVRPWQDRGQQGGVARRAIQEFSLGPGCAFWLMKEAVGGGESPLSSDIQTALGAHSGPGCWLGEHSPC